MKYEILKLIWDSHLDEWKEGGGIWDVTLCSLMALIQCLSEMLVHIYQITHIISQIMLSWKFWD